MQNLFWKPACTSDGNFHGIPNPWNCFQAFQSPQRSSCKLFFAHFCESLLFQCSSISWEHSIVSHHVFTDVAGMTQRVILLKNLFTASPLLLGAILRFFASHFRACSSIFESCFPSCLMKFCILYRCFLYNFGSQCVKKNSTSCILL